MWVGLRRKRRTSLVDYSIINDGPNPLWEDEDDELWSYADGSDFDPASDFGLELSGFTTYPCIHLRSSSGFTARATSCDGKAYPFLCRWTGLECPAGYTYHGQISDGRTCHGLGLTGTGNTDHMCHDPAAPDDLRRPSLPVTRVHAEIIARELR